MQEIILDVVVGGVPAEVQVIRRPSRRRRSMAVAVTRDNEVRVYYPARTSERRVRQFVASKRSWIERALQRAQSKASPVRIAGQAGERVTVRGESKSLVVCTSASDAVQEEAEQIVCHAADTDSGYVQKLLRNWLQALAKQEIGAMYDDFCRQINLDNPPALRWRYMKSQWGSYNARTHTITINISLISTPREAMAYLIAHEIAHIQHRNHSARYYAHLALLYPQYREHSKLLREYAPVSWE